MRKSPTVNEMRKAMGFNPLQHDKEHYTPIVYGERNPCGEINLIDGHIAGCSTDGGFEIKNNNAYFTNVHVDSLKFSDTQKDVIEKVARAAQFNAEYPTGVNMNTLSTASGNVASTATVRNQSLEVDFDQAVWKIDLPGVEPKDVEVFTVKDRAYVQVQDRPKALEFILAEGETVKGSTFALGVLAVTIDRPHKKVPVKVN